MDALLFYCSREETEAAAFLTSNPKYSDLPISDFTFQVPKIMDDTIPGDVARKTSASGDGKKEKTRRQEKLFQVNMPGISSQLPCSEFYFGSCVIGVSWL
ncbi:hypothetical protein Ddye_003092 [Dipteronia dyeriana]|uniref:Uncharacterized protein n=1 Tax=Dipteronia dyeriana TaxID=168575 RepID=A0AAD9XSB0_9ROSI|nr:hypothetical protein Ddye_003092 [Dipteronia dyeriana]